MPDFPARLARRVVLPLAVVALFAGCRDEAAPESPLATDSALARDLEMAQRDVAGPMVFNDAPLDAPAPAAPSATTPAPRREPARATAPAPRPVPRPAPQRTPAPAPREPVVAAAPATAPAPAGGVIGAGTRVGMTTNGRVCAATALAGDKFTATVTSATTGSNGAVIRPAPRWCWRWPRWSAPTRWSAAGSASASARLT